MNYEFTIKDIEKTTFEQLKAINIPKLERVQTMIIEPKQTMLHKMMSILRLR